MMVLYFVRPAESDYLNHDYCKRTVGKRIEVQRISITVSVEQKG